jgi:ribosomal protein L14
MLRIGSTVNICDRSGALTVFILNMKKKKTYKSSYLRPSDLFLGVVKKISFRGGKLRRHQFVSSIVISTRKKLGRGNGLFVTYDHNVGLPLKFGFFVSAVSPDLSSLIMYEVSRLKRYKGVLRYIPKFF